MGNAGEVTGTSSDIPSGVLELNPVEIEAIRGLTLAQQSLDARKRATVNAVLQAHGCPPGAILSVSSLETGEATWSRPGAKKGIPEPGESDL